MEHIQGEVQGLVDQVTGGQPTGLQTPTDLAEQPDRRTGNYFPNPAACPTCGADPVEPGYLMADVPVNHKDFGKLTPCPTCHASKLSPRLRDASQLEGDLMGYTFDNYKVDEENRLAYQAALNFTNRKTGWLTLWGTFGPGKTHLLAAIANSLTKAGEGVIYYTLPDLLDKLRDSYKDDFSGTFHQVANVPVLLADEVDKINPTLWALEKAYQLFDARYRLQGQLGTVFAMNDRPEVSDTEIDHLFSRMLDHRFEVVEVGGGDMRPVRGES